MVELHYGLCRHHIYVLIFHLHLDFLKIVRYVSNNVTGATY